MTDIIGENRVIAFFDFLGFKNILKEERRINELKSFLIWLRQGDKIIGELGPDNPVKFHIDVSSYSDNVIMSVKLNDSYNKETKDGILGQFLLGVGFIQRLALEKGFLMRGAIAYGDIYFDNAKNLIFGIPVSEAVDAEKGLALFPRIIFCQSLLDLIQQNICGFFEKNEKSRVIRRDFDGMYFIDYLSMAKSDSTIADMYTIISKLIDNTDDFSYSNKIYWLANLYDINAKIWNKHFPAKLANLFDLLVGNFENILSQ